MSKKLIYADHAATTQLCDAAWAAMTPFLREEFGNPSSLHSFAKKPREAVATARATIAECIGAEPDEIFFTSGGTESNNWVIKGTTGGLMVSTYEHHAVLNAALSEEKKGRGLVYCKPTLEGEILPSRIRSRWNEDIRLVSVMTANNEVGRINPIDDLVSFVHDKGALFHTDAVQAVGHIPIDVKRSGVDFLSASAHKFNGPRGVGFLYVRKGVELSSLMNGGQQEYGLRAGTENVAGVVGMAAALKWHCGNLEKNTVHLNNLKARLVDGILGFAPGAFFPAFSKEGQLPGFVSVAFEGKSAEGLLHLLDLKGIAVSSGAACDTKNTQVSHVLKAMRIPKRMSESVLRISFGWENTIKDVDYIVSVLKRFV